jgi:hypothetical protein
MDHRDDLDPPADETIRNHEWRTQYHKLAGIG